MKKMITLAVAAFSLNSAVACEPYAAVGFGPFLMVPNLTIGARFDDWAGQMDVSACMTYDVDFQIVKLAASKLVFLDNLYLGPSYCLSFHRFRYVGEGSQGMIGGVIGKDSTNHFIEVSAYVPAVHKGLKLNGAQVMFKVGVKF